MNDEVFWLVWNPEGPQAPKYRHSSKAGADQEAKRLARLNPGQSFYLLFATDRFEVDSIKHTSLVYNDAPF